ncbi:hypothetical protein SRHO_G00338350 [Serrasalmus rhombeus]
MLMEKSQRGPRKEHHIPIDLQRHYGKGRHGADTGTRVRKEHMVQKCVKYVLVSLTTPQARQRPHMANQAMLSGNHEETLHPARCEGKNANHRGAKRQTAHTALPKDWTINFQRISPHDSLLTGNCKS